MFIYVGSYYCYLIEGGVNIRRFEFRSLTLGRVKFREFPRCAKFRKQYFSLLYTHNGGGFRKKFSIGNCVFRPVISRFLRFAQPDRTKRTERLPPRKRILRAFAPVDLQHDK